MVNTPPQTDTYSTALDIFDRTHPLRVDIDENLKVTGAVTAIVSGSVAVTNFPANQSVTQGTSPWVISGTVTANAGTGTLLVDGSAHTQPISAVALPLPSGAATSANQTTEITDLGTIISNQTNGTQQVIANAGTNLNTSALALDATVSKLNIAQGSSVIGKTGPLIQGMVEALPAAGILTPGQVQPISLSPSGSVLIASTDPFTKSQNWVDEFHAIRANPIARLAGTSFVGNTKDTNFWAETDTGTGSVTQSGGVVVLATGATANSTTQYQSVRVARWVTGNENTYRTVLKVGDTGTANNTRNWGAFTTTDGFFFQLKGTTVNIVSRFNSVDTAVAQASWNGVGASSFTLDTNYHVYEIKYAYADIHFYIDKILVHNLVPTTTFFSQTLNLNSTLQNNNSGGSTSNVNMTVGVAFISRTGLLETESQYFHGTTDATTTLKFGAGKLHTITLNQYGNASATITIYDNVSATAPVIGVIGGLAGATPNSLSYRIPFSNGLTLVSVGTWDYTVTYE